VISGVAFCEAAKLRGVSFATGVPCSLFAPVINAAMIDRDLRYLAANNEGECVAVAAGAWLAGQTPMAMFQNSGLGNALSPLSSLHATFSIPTLLVVSWRGQPGQVDEPQHLLMGQITLPILRLLEIEATVLDADQAMLAEALDMAVGRMERARRPVALIVTSGLMIEPPPPPAARELKHAGGELDDVRAHGSLPTRGEIIRAFVEHSGSRELTIATTGMCARELYATGDSPAFFYQIGSMGCVAALGLGVALHSQARVHVLDGDGSLMMRMGVMSLVGPSSADNLVHIVLDNGVHASTGGQQTGSLGLDLAAIALGCGYRRVHACDSTQGFVRVLAEAAGASGPQFVHVRIRTERAPSPPRIRVPPTELATRFRDHVLSLSRRPGIVSA
jgi:phosphonopyruvate decarboxylase